jgi:hypothetical protein
MELHSLAIKGKPCSDVLDAVVQVGLSNSNSFLYPGDCVSIPRRDHLRYLRSERPIIWIIIQLIIAIIDPDHGVKSVAVEASKFDFLGSSIVRKIS